ncbi:MAG TPA: tetratricopeptide repeat protein [Pirellulales bacterium]|jgi:tetratricopeptide (TPR) repeat protein|nr:tetratricopeptide repeat protein [Pirellulales bacterium]
MSQSMVDEQPQIGDDEAAAERAFDAGDYTTAALEAGSDELRGAALVLLGNHEEGMPLLERLSSPRAILYHAFGLWGMGYYNEADGQLAQVCDDLDVGSIARGIRQFIKRRQIRILLQGRDDPNCPDYDFVGAIRAMPHFDVTTVGFSSKSDIVIDHQTTYDEMVQRLPTGWRPDFFLSHLVEDNPPPIGIENAFFPTICHTQDFDRHFHHCRHYLPLFDAVVTLGRTDHEDMQRLTGGSVFVFPKLLGVSAKAERETFKRRNIDVFISGTLFNHTRAKGRHLFDISQLPSRYNIELLDGYISADDYYRRLGQAKATFTFVNRCGLINGRAIEAISQGTCAVYQEGGELGLFLNEEDGAVPYTPGNELATLTKVVDQWDTRYHRFAENGQRKVRKVFGIETCLERYMHFVALCSLRGIQRERRAVDPVFSSMRYPNRSPQRSWFHFDYSMSKVLDLQTRFRTQFADSSAYAHLDACGESALYSYLIARPHVSSLADGSKPDWFYKRTARWAIPVAAWLKKRPAVKAFIKPFLGIVPYSKRLRNDVFAHLTYEQLDVLVTSALETYRNLAEKFPAHMAAHFNLARIRYEKGYYEEAQADFERVLRDETLQYHPKDLLFWREFHDYEFDYDLMMHEIVAHARDGNPSHLRLIERAIRESSRLYLAKIQQRAGQLEAAGAALAEAPSEGWQFPATSLERARIEMRLKHFSAAEQHLRQALTLDRVLLTQISHDELVELHENGCELSDLLVECRFLKHRSKNR